MTKDEFWDYFNCADEIYESLVKQRDQSKPTEGADPLTLADLDPAFVTRAMTIAKEMNFPWPPYLPHAEEYALAHREEVYT